MIDFRYHLVSIVAVFLALAIGIVIGVQGLSTKFADSLASQAQRVAKNNTQVYEQNAQLSKQIAADQAFAQAASGMLLSHLLQGQQVVIVTAPNADGATLTGITAALQQAGATVTGQVSLSSQFFDTSTATESALTALAGQVAPPGITLPGSPAAGRFAGQQAAAQVIASALVSKDGLSVLTARQSQAIMSGFAQQGYLQVSTSNGGTNLTGQATLAVVVTPAAVPPAGLRGPLNAVLLGLSADLQVAGNGMVLAGSVAGSGAGSAIDAAKNGNVGVAFTTVDFADTESGQIVVAQALSRLLGPHATPTSYGVSTGSVPSPAPSGVPPAPSPSLSPRKKAVK